MMPSVQKKGWGGGKGRESMPREYGVEVSRLPRGSQGCQDWLGSSPRVSRLPKTPTPELVLGIRGMLRGNSGKGRFKPRILDQARGTVLETQDVRESQTPDPDI